MTEAVQDRHGVTHAIASASDYGWAGRTVCDLRFWTVRFGTPHVFSLERDQRMAESETLVNCMTCLVRGDVINDSISR